MPKSLVGRVKNRKFAYFWLLIGGSIGNILFIMYNPSSWLVFLPPAVLSILLMIAVADSMKRPRLFIGIDLLLTLALLVFLTPHFGTTLRELAALLPEALIIFGCILGVMKW